MGAATTAQDIRDAIKVAGGQVVVTGDTLGSAAIASLLAEYGKDKTLTISKAEIVSAPEDEFVTVRGDIGLLGVKVSGTVRFFIGGSEAQLELLGTPPGGWTLGASFDKLKGTHLAGLPLGSPRLRMLSLAADGVPRGVTLTAGFTLPPAMEALRWVAAPGADSTISGPVGLDAGAPVMTLTVSPTIHASLGGLVDIDLTMQHASRTFRKGKAAEDTPTVTAVSLLNGDLSFTHDGAPVTVPMQASFNDKLGVLHLQVVTGNVFDLGLSEIAHWLGGTNLASEGLPATYQPPGGLTLHDVDFAIGLNTKSLEYVKLTVVSTKPWEVVDKISVSGIVLGFMVMPGRTPKLSATIEGTLELGTAVKLDIYSQLPDFLIRGHLAEDSPIDLIPLIEHLGGVSAGLPSTLRIDVLSFEAHPAGSFYSFDIDVVGDWRIVEEFAIEELKAGVHYDGGALDVAFEGRFTVGGADLRVSAEYDSEAGGWRFEGEAGEDKPLRVSDFITRLARQFSAEAAQALPEFVTSLQIEHLRVSFDTANKEFIFHCETLFSVEGTALDLTLQVTVRKGDGGYAQIYAGSLVIGALRFDLVFESAKPGGDVQPSTMFLAAVRQPEGGVDVKALVGRIDAGAGALMPALTLKLENALFLYRKSGTAPATYLFGLALGVDLDLSALPLVGPVFHESGVGGIKDVQALYASAPVGADDVTAFNTLLGQAQAKPPLPTRKGATGATPVLDKGFNFAANIELGSGPMPLGAGGTSSTPATPAKPATPAPAKPPSGNASWLEVKKSVGPVTLERIGVRYEDGRAWLLVDASLLLAGLSLGLQGLALGFKLDDFKDVSANLDGLSLEYETGALSIAGGFLRFGGDYLGEAKVRAGVWGLTAIGGYAPADRSFFIFARLTAPLGGPPYFFVTGLAGGFGVNRDLVIPPIDSLTSFALLPANNKFPPTLDGKDPGKTLADTLATTAGYIPVRPGANWAAAGIDFTSFQMVDSSALVAVSFGVEFAVSLLGICRVTVPKLAPDAIVYLEIALEARVKPAEGIVAVDGRLTPASYLFARLCRITGGFAFYLWFSGKHEGDFVFSIGGYHPRFKKPDYYPVVPRLQIVYQVGSLVIKGQTYLALTPHMVMAGMRIDATWETSALKAWFSAGVDFLMGWRPFHYEADAFIHIGVSLTLDLLFTSVSITVHVGVDLSMWGPPFGGKAVIDLDIVSFTIYFGDDPRREAVDWAGFKSSFLPGGADRSAAAPRHAMLAAEAVGDPAPADGLLCTASITEGLVRELRAKDAAEFFSWIVDADHFAIQSSTLIPSKQATYNGFDLQMPFTRAAGFKAPASGSVPAAAYDDAKYPGGVSWTDRIGVLPMKLAPGDIVTHHTVRVKRAPEGADYTAAASYIQDVDDIAVGPLVKRASAALWAPTDPGLNGERLIADTLVGLRVSPVPQHPDITLKADLWAMLFDQNQRVAWRGSAPAPDTSDPYDASEDGSTLTFQLGGQTVTCQEYQLTALVDPGAAAARSGMVVSLNGLGLSFAPDEIDVADLAHYPLWDWPMIRTLGEEIPAT